MSHRTILITGATGKLGRVLVAHFLALGDRVIATARSKESLDRLIEQQGGARETLAMIPADLVAPEGCGDLVQQLTALELLPDCLIYSARSIEFLNVEAGGRVSRQNFASELLLDVIAPYELTMTLINVEACRIRRIVNIGSQYGTVAVNPNLYGAADRQTPIHYSVAKAALAHLTRELAVRLAPRGIQLNCVALGGIEGRVGDDFKKRYAQLCPLGRMLRDDDLVGPVDMLLSDACSGITGQVLAVDGGWTIW